MAETDPPVPRKKDPSEPRKGRQRFWILRALGTGEEWKRADTLAVLGIVVAIVFAIVGPLLAVGGGSGTTNINNNKYYGPSVSSDPQEQIVQQTGSYSVAGFHDAIVNRENSIVALYLESGMPATTLDKGASIILFGFQGEQNGDPVALVKTVQAARFKVDEELQDSYLMGALTDNIFPLTFNTPLAPKGYTGGYQGGTFVGSLLFWIVQRALGTSATDQDLQVIKYLISQGADCKIPLSFIEYNGPIALAGTSPYNELLPMMQSCA